MLPNNLDWVISTTETYFLTDLEVRIQGQDISMLSFFVILFPWPAVSAVLLGPCVILPMYMCISEPLIFLNIKLEHPFWVSFQPKDQLKDLTT
jgi:hypothetical protein